MENTVYIKVKVRYNFISCRDSTEPFNSKRTDKDILGGISIFSLINFNINSFLMIRYSEKPYAHLGANPLR